MTAVQRRGGCTIDRDPGRVDVKPTAPHPTAPTRTHASGFLLRSGRDAKDSSRVARHPVFA
jgi:hypothetical protein